MRPREFLVDTLIHLSPPRALEGLPTDLAERRLVDLPHSIADIVAHMSFWQEWFTRRIEGADEPMAATAAAGWPAVAPGTWPDVESRFLTGVEALVALGERLDLNAPLSPAIGFEPMAHYSVGDVMQHAAQHNAHHLGQVVVLRQLLGAWPPPAGSWTW
jgi:uncharacterized damage-inducible protein DinB